MVGPTDAVAADEAGTPEVADIGMMQTKSVTVTFDGPGPYAYACHAPGPKGPGGGRGGAGAGGFALPPTTRSAAHDKHAGHSVAMFRDKFWLSLALTIPVLLWSRDPQAWLGYAAPRFPGSDWIPAVLGTAVFLYGGLVFLRGAAGELRAGSPG